MRRIPDWIRGLVPLWLADAYRRLRHGRTWFDPRGRSVRIVFTEIYRRNLWGGHPGELYSGPGSELAVAEPYIRAVTEYIHSHGIRSVVDLGCGDFRVGREVVAAAGVRYCGVDVVPELIERNQEAFGSELVRFACQDITRDSLPPADLCLIRQVLQHLSNAQIRAVLQNCSHYSGLIVTEHVLPEDKMILPNLDIRHGVETRVEIGSAVVLSALPFDLPVVEVLCDVPLPDGSIIRTVRLNGSPATPG